MITKSCPSSFGKITTKLFDEYPVYKYEISSDLIEHYLPKKLTPFASKSLKNSAKKYVFYSKPIIIASRAQIDCHQREFLPPDIKFEDLLNELLSTNNPSIRYNFIVADNSIIFAKIPHLHHVTYHLLCKHITLGNRSHDVRFAGELWKNGKNLFQLNNNSGTYRPSLFLTRQTARLFNRLVPSIDFQGVSFEQR